MGCLAAFEDRGWGVKRLLWIAGKEPTPALAQMAGRGGVLHCSGRMRDLGARCSALEADGGRSWSLLVRRLLLVSLRYCFLFSLFPDRTP